MFKKIFKKKKTIEQIRIVSLNYLNICDRNDTKTIESDEKPPKKANIDDALEATNFGKFNYFLMLISGVLLTSPLLELLSISFILPVTDCDLNLKTEQKGILSAVQFFGIMTSSYLWGYLADRVGRRKILRPAIMAAFSTTFACSFLNSFWLLIAFRFLNGFFISAGSSIPLAYLGEFHTNKIRSKAIMGASIMYGLSPLIVSALAWLMINQSWQFYIPLIDIFYKPWRLFMILSALPALLCALCLFVIPESPKFTLLQNNHKETMNTLRRMYAINTGKRAEEYAFTEIIQEENSSNLIENENMHPIYGVFKSMWRQTLPLFQRNFLRQTLLVCIIRFLIYILTNGMNVWFPQILDKIGEYQSNNFEQRTSTICEIFHLKTMKISNNISKEQIFQCKESLDISTYYNSISLEIAYLVGFVLLTFIVSHVSKVKLLFSILFVTGVSGVTAMFVTIPILATYLYLILMLGGIGSIVLNIIIVNIYPTSLRAMAVSLTFLAGYLGGIFGANIIGTLLDHQCMSAFLFAAGSIILAAFLAILIPKTIKDTPPSSDTV